MSTTEAPPDNAESTEAPVETAAQAVAAAMKAEAEVAEETVAAGDDESAEKPAKKSEKRAKRSDSRPKRVEISLEQKLESGVAAAKEALTLLGVEVASLDGRIDNEQVVIALGTVTKPEGAVLEGRVYESLQFILNKSVNKHALRRTRLRIEAAGFTGRRGDRLDKPAHALARKVSSMRRSVTIGPLGDDDLRQFTSQLHRAGGVVVQQVGDKDAKRLLVTPGSGGRKRRRR